MLILERKVSHLNHLPVLNAALLQHIVLGILPELLLDLIYDALNERLLHLTIDHTVVLAEYPRDLLPTFAPLALLLLLGDLLTRERSLYLAVELHPLFVVLAALALGVLALVLFEEFVEVVFLVLDYDCAGDEALALVLEDIKE